MPIANIVDERRDQRVDPADRNLDIVVGEREERVAGMPYRSVQLVALLAAIGAKDGSVDAERGHQRSGMLSA